MKKNYIIPIFVPHLGCPNDCIFCNQKKITGRQNSLNGEQVEQKIARYLTTFPQKTNRTVEVGYYGGSFTGIELAKQKELLSPATRAYQQNLISGIRLSTRPDYIDEKILAHLQNYEVQTIELGVQSLEEKVLAKAKRGHNVQSIYQAVKLIKQKGFRLGIQLMVGLPEDSQDSFLSTVKKTIALQPNFVRLYPTLVIRDTYLAELYQQGKYQPLSLDEAVYLCKEAYKAFTAANIPVIRLGLQSSEEISHSGDVLAGPYHPAFRELVENIFFREKIEKILERENREGQEELLIFVHPSKISITVGQKRKNIAYLLDKYKLTEIKVIADICLAPTEINLKFRKNNI